jgi:hypothetical protein
MEEWGGCCWRMGGSTCGFFYTARIKKKYPTGLRELENNIPTDLRELKHNSSFLACAMTGTPTVYVRQSLRVSEGDDRLGGGLMENVDRVGAGCDPLLPRGRRGLGYRGGLCPRSHRLSVRLPSSGGVARRVGLAWSPTEGTVSSGQRSAFWACLLASWDHGRGGGGGLCTPRPRNRNSHHQRRRCPAIEPPSYS